MWCVISSLVSRWPPSGKIMIEMTAIKEEQCLSLKQSVFVTGDIPSASLFPAGRGNSDCDKRSGGAQRQLQCRRHHAHQGSHQHARFCRAEPAVWAQWWQVQHKNQGRTMKAKLVHRQHLCLGSYCYVPFIHVMHLQVWSSIPLHVGCVRSWLEGSGQANGKRAGLRQLPAGRGLLHAGWTDIWDHCRVQSPADAGGRRCGLVQLPHAHLKGHWCGKASLQCIYNTMLMRDV